MKNRLIFSLLFALSLAACSGSPATPEASTPKGSADNSSDVIAGDPNLSEQVDAIDNTPAALDLGLNASIPGWTGTKFAFNDPKEIERGKAVTTDSSGNVIVLAELYGDVVKGPVSDGNGGTYLTEIGYTHPRNVGIAKIDSSGNRVWLRTLGSNNQSSVIYGIGGKYDLSGQLKQILKARATSVAGAVTDASGNIYVTGFTRTNLSNQTNAGGDDGYVAKYSSTGNLLWTRVFGAIGDDGTTGITINGTNIYLTGYACGDGFSFLGNKIRGACDVFVTKYESNGNRLWARLFGSSGNDIAAKIAKVSSGGAVVVGTYQGAATDTNGKPSNKDGFAIRLDPNGNTIWNRTISTNLNDDVFAVTVSSDAVYVGGETKGNLNGVTRPRTRTDDRGDAFILKLGLVSGNTLWTRYVAPDNVSGANNAFAYTTDLALNSSGQLFAFGDGYNGAINNADISWPVRYDTAGNRTTDAGVRGFSTPDGNSSNAKVAMSLGADGVFVLLDDFTTRTTAQEIASVDEVFITKLGFDLKQK